LELVRKLLSAGLARDTNTVEAQSAADNIFGALGVGTWDTNLYPPLLFALNRNFDHVARSAQSNSAAGFAKLRNTIAMFETASGKSSFDARGYQLLMSLAKNAFARSLVADVVTVAGPNPTWQTVANQTNLLTWSTEVGTVFGLIGLGAPAAVNSQASDLQSQLNSANIFEAVVLGMAGLIAVPEAAIPAIAAILLGSVGVTAAVLGTMNYCAQASTIVRDYVQSSVADALSFTTALLYEIGVIPTSAFGNLGKIGGSTSITTMNLYISDGSLALIVQADLTVVRERMEAQFLGLLGGC
jgi:hypothetical protein